MAIGLNAEICRALTRDLHAMPVQISGVISPASMAMTSYRVQESREPR